MQSWASAGAVALPMQLGTAPTSVPRLLTLVRKLAQLERRFLILFSVAAFYRYNKHYRDAVITISMTIPLPMILMRVSMLPHYAIPVTMKIHRRPFFPDPFRHHIRNDTLKPNRDDYARPGHPSA